MFAVSPSKEGDGKPDRVVGICASPVNWDFTIEVARDSKSIYILRLRDT